MCPWESSTYVKKIKRLIRENGAPNSKSIVKPNHIVYQESFTFSSGLAHCYRIGESL